MLSDNIRKLANEIGGKLYKAICPTFGYKFAFHAKDQKDAADKIAGYNTYHSFIGSDKFIAEEAKPGEVKDTWIHDEYVDFKRSFTNDIAQSLMNDSELLEYVERNAMYRDKDTYLGLLFDYAENNNIKLDRDTAEYVVDSYLITELGIN